tara:strand:- start:27139 stop:27402 length:264 start_codon:yes stop_codon:yes gene_type:complete
VLSHIPQFIHVIIFSRRIVRVFGLFPGPVSAPYLPVLNQDARLTEVATVFSTHDAEDTNDAAPDIVSLQRISGPFVLKLINMGCQTI